MLGRVMCALGAVLVPVSMAGVDQAFGQSDLMTQGQQLYEQHCSVCHQPAGEGVAPVFPALAGNTDLDDLSLIVTNIHQGKGAMPPFPSLTAEQIAALATYIRNSWGNNFGEVTTEEVTPLLEGLPAAAAEAPAEAPAAEAPADAGAETPAAETPAAETPAAGASTIWDGVFTEEQVARGEDAYAACTRCHGRRLNGAPDDPDMKSTPPLARAAFLRDWNGRTLASLYEFTRATMPQNNPGSLSDQQYVDIIAYMLSVSEAPAGDAELPPDPAVLGDIVIQQR